MDQQGTAGSVKRATLNAGAPPTLSALTSVTSGAAAVTPDPDFCALACTVTCQNPAGPNVVGSIHAQRRR